LFACKLLTHDTGTLLRRASSLATCLPMWSYKRIFWVSLSSYISCGNVGICCPNTATATAFALNSYTRAMYSPLLHNTYTLHPRLAGSITTVMVSDDERSNEYRERVEGMRSFVKQKELPEVNLRSFVKQKELPEVFL